MPPSNHALRARRVRLACCNLGKPRRIGPQQGGVRQRLGTSPRSRARACLFEPPQATSHRLRGLFSRRVLCRRLHPVRVPEPALPARPGLPAPTSHARHEARRAEQCVADQGTRHAEAAPGDLDSLPAGPRSAHGASPRGLPSLLRTVGQTMHKAVVMHRLRAHPTLVWGP